MKLQTVSDTMEDQVRYISALQTQNDKLRHANQETMNKYNRLKMKYNELDSKYEQQRKLLDAKSIVDTNWGVGVNDYFDGCKDFDGFKDFNHVLDMAINDMTL